MWSTLYFTSSCVAYPPGFIKTMYKHRLDYGTSRSTVEAVAKKVYTRQLVTSKLFLFDYVFCNIFNYITIYIVLYKHYFDNFLRSNQKIVFFL